MKNIFKTWILPILISAGLFAGVRPILAQQLQGGITLSDYLKSNNVEVGSEEKNGYRQIYYIWNDNKVFITDTNYTNSDPVTDKENIVWIAQMDSGWRVFMYNILSGTTVQLTQTGINVNPRISGNSVVWEAQNEKGVWQVDLFDGKSVKQITQGDMSLNPDIEGGYIAYGRKDAVGWRGSLYSIKEGKEVDISTGENAKEPKLKNGKIYLLADSGGKEEFALTAEDFFVLDLLPLAASDLPPTVSEVDILQELSDGAVAGEATESGDLQSATESGYLNNEL